jgi:hypothetical protein
MSCTLWLLDVLAWVMDVYRAVGKWCTAALVGLRRDASIVLKGHARYDRFKVIGPEDHRVRAIVAWFYRWHDAPDTDEWADCLARFGLDYVPTHSLLYWKQNHPAGAVRVNATIDLERNWMVLNAVRDQRLVTPPVRNIGIGDLAPRKMLEHCLAQS